MQHIRYILLKSSIGSIIFLIQYCLSYSMVLVSEFRVFGSTITILLMIFELIKIKKKV